jgi:hypothetical protein
MVSEAGTNASDPLRDRYCFNAAAQLTTTVNGAVRPPACVVMKRNRFGSDAGVHPTGMSGGGAVKSRLGVPA